VLWSTNMLSNSTNENEGRKSPIDLIFVQAGLTRTNLSLLSLSSLVNPPTRENSSNEQVKNLISLRAIYERENTASVTSPSEKVLPIDNSYASITQNFYHAISLATIVAENHQQSFNDGVHDDGITIAGLAANTVDIDTVRYNKDLGQFWLLYTKNASDTRSHNTNIDGKVIGCPQYNPLYEKDWKPVDKDIFGLSRILLLEKGSVYKDENKEYTILDPHSIFTAEQVDEVDARIMGAGDSHSKPQEPQINHKSISSCTDKPFHNLLSTKYGVLNHRTDSVSFASSLVIAHDAYKNIANVSTKYDEKIDALKHNIIKMQLTRCLDIAATNTHNEVKRGTCQVLKTLTQNVSKENHDTERLRQYALIAIRNVSRHSYNNFFSKLFGNRTLDKCKSWLSWLITPSPRSYNCSEHGLMQVATMCGVTPDQLYAVRYGSTKDANEVIHGRTNDHDQSENSSISLNYQYCKSVLFPTVDKENTSEKEKEQDKKTLAFSQLYKEIENACQVGG
jgi:hypothetical protein